MIPRIQTGSSFKGAGLYYLHDKKRDGETERFTTERVAWTFTLNTLENDPEAALAEMRQTVRDQALLKMLSGNRPDGRPTEKTVMTVALAWSPEQTPTRDDMIDAGQSFLTHMGWEGHQVLFVAHKDTPHPHVHMIINRVHPDTGMTIDGGWSKIRAQKWALAFEHEHGRVFCEAREAKYGRDQSRDAASMTYREWKQWQEIARDSAIEPEFRRAVEAGEWTVLKEGQRDRRISFWEETAAMRKELRTALREAVRDEFAPAWSQYAREKEERDRKALAYDREVRRALRHYRRQGPLHGIESVAQIKERQKAFHARQREEWFQTRVDIAGRQRERLAELSDPALRRLSEDRALLYRDVLKDQRKDRAALRADQADGDKRPDLLSQYGATKGNACLTAEQKSAYVASAREEAKAAHANNPAQRRAPPEPTQTSDAARGSEQIQAREMTDKDRALEAKRKAGLEWYLAKRDRDRSRERDDGGRDR